MLFDNRDRLEEDLERIRKANLPPEKLIEEEEREEAEKRTITEALNSEETKITAKDILAMTIAIISLILPYLLVIFLAIGLVLLFFFRQAIF